MMATSSDRPKARRAPWGDEEPAVLAQRILEKPTGADERALQSFVVLRYEKPFATSRRWGTLYGWAFTVLSVVGIAGGLAVSALGAEGDADEAVVAIGLLVSLSTAINQVWQPGQRSVARNQGANALRREGWDYVWERGHYADKDPRGRLNVFVDEVQRVNRAVEAIDEQQRDGEGGGR